MKEIRKCGFMVPEISKTGSLQRHYESAHKLWEEAEHCEKHNQHWLAYIYFLRFIVLVVNEIPKHTQYHLLSKEKREFRNKSNLALDKLPQLEEKIKEKRKKKIKALELLRSTKIHWGEVLDTPKNTPRDILDIPEQKTLTKNNPENLEANLKKGGFKLIRVPGDGNCQMHALADQLKIVHKKHISHTQVRKDITEWLNNNKNTEIDKDGTTLLVASGISDWEKYVENMKKYGTWGDEITLLAASVFYRVKIKVFSSLSEYVHTIECPFLVKRYKSKDLVIGHYHEVHYSSSLKVN